MPCVLPVLSLKLLSVVRHGGGHRGEVRLSFVASAAGILFSYLVLASAAVALKSAGAAVGWGIQFQHPLFLIALALIVTLFAYDMWGMYEIHLPSWLANIAGPSGTGHGVIGHFATGAFATLLATPCTAPFLGTAVGFALARSTVDTYAVFTALGLGMAIPYLTVAAVPALATRLPKPGPWMIRLRQVLGVALAATAAWLLSVLAAQVSTVAALTIAAVLIALGIVLYVGRRLPRSWRSASTAIVILLAAGAFFVPGQFARNDRAADVVAEDYWQPFDQDAIPRLVAEGKTVFVDVTADWCITCQFNKSAVLNRGEVYQRLTGGNVVAMKADWTRPNDEIAAYLARFGKYGIPFNVVYGPGAERGVVLPELLTTSSVLAAFDEADPASNLARQ
jgi:suppressor for copper-sensitivity B